MSKAKSSTAASIVPADILHTAEIFNAADAEFARLSELIATAPGRKVAALAARERAEADRRAALDNATVVMAELGPDSDRLIPIRSRIADANAAIEGAIGDAENCDVVIAGSLSDELAAARSAAAAAAEALVVAVRPFLETIVSDWAARWEASIAPLVALIREGSMLDALWEGSSRRPDMYHLLGNLKLPSARDPQHHFLVAGGDAKNLQHGGAENLRHSWREAPEIQPLLAALGPVASSFTRAHRLRQAAARQAQAEIDRAMFAATARPPESPPATYPPGHPGTSYTTTRRDPSSP